MIDEVLSDCEYGFEQLKELVDLGYWDRSIRSYSRNG
jgi:hypothetical protein